RRSLRRRDRPPPCCRSPDPRGRSPTLRRRESGTGGRVLRSSGRGRRLLPDEASMSWQDCIAEIERAAGRRLSDEEQERIFERLNRVVRRRQAETRLENVETELREAAADEAANVLTEARIARRNAALNVLARERIE